MAGIQLPDAGAEICSIGSHLEVHEGSLFRVKVEGRKARLENHTVRSLSVKDKTTRPSFCEIVKMRYTLIPRCWCRSCPILAKGPRVVCVDHKALWRRFLPGSLRHIADRSGLCNAVKTVADGTMQLGPRHRGDTCTAGIG